MKVDVLPLSKIRRYGRNPRRNEDVIDKLCQSLSAFGWRQPLVVDEDFVLVVGDARFLAAKRNGLTDAPVHIARDLSAEQIRAYRIMDNRSREDGDWDLEALKLELGDLAAGDLPLSLTGFEDDELRELLSIDSLFTGLVEDDDVPELQTKLVATRPGDLFRLGPHRLLCGDATVPADMLRAVGPKACDMAWTDPPYNVGVEGKAGKIKNDQMADAAFREFLRRSLANLAGCLKEGAPVYVAHSETEGVNFRRAFEGAGFQLSSCLIWAKDSFVMGRSDYHWQHEPILYGWKKGQKHTWHGGRAASTVLEIPRPKRSDEHPTMKPVDLVGGLIANSSVEGATVIDPFGGSGTTLIACHREGRIARLVELDPVYCDVIVNRWQRFTGESAFREEGDVPFDEIERIPVRAT